MTSTEFLRHPWVQGITASDKTMDEAYKRHLMMNFRKHISNHFAQKANGNEFGLREIFNLIDIAGNGVLDANELRVALRAAGEADDVITKIVSSFDFKNQGSKVSGVTFDDFKRIMNEG